MLFGFKFSLTNLEWILKYMHRCGFDEIDISNVVIILSRAQRLP